MSRYTPLSIVMWRRKPAPRNPASVRPQEDADGARRAGDGLTRHHRGHEPSRPERLREDDGRQDRTRTAGRQYALDPPTCPAPILVPPVDAVCPRDHLVAPPVGKIQTHLRASPEWQDETGGDVQGGGSACTPPQRPAD